MVSRELISLDSLNTPGSRYVVRLAKTPRDLQEAKALDDAVLGAHLGISMEELEEIHSQSGVILLHSRQGELVGESQVITSPITQHQELAPDEAYNYGTALRPEYQGKGAAQTLFAAQEYVARESGKQRATLTVRLENGLSIRGRMKAGYSIVSYNPQAYEGENGARFIMEKRLDDAKTVFDPALLASLLSQGDIVMTDPKQLPEHIQRQRSLAVPVHIGDKIDVVAHSMMGTIFEHQYVGAGLLRPSEWGGKEPDVSLLIFTKPQTPIQ